MLDRENSTKIDFLEQATTAFVEKLNEELRRIITLSNTNSSDVMTTPKQANYRAIQEAVDTVFFSEKHNRFTPEEMGDVLKRIIMDAQVAAA